MLIRRLIGSGVALDVPVNVLQSIHELPAHPPDGAILVLPKDCNLNYPDPNKRGWARILIVTTEQGPPIPGVGRIIPSSMEKPNTTWSQILQTVFEAGKTPFTSSSWHSTRLQDQIPFADLPLKLLSWAKIQKIISYASIGSILKSLEQLTGKLGSRIVDFEMSADATSFQLTLSCADQDDMIRKAFTDISASPYAQLSYVRKGENSTIAWLKVDFGVPATSRICLITNDESSEDTDRILDQEAS